MKPMHCPMAVWQCYIKQPTHCPMAVWQCYIKQPTHRQIAVCQWFTGQPNYSHSRHCPTVCIQYSQPTWHCQPYKITINQPGKVSRSVNPLDDLHSVLSIDHLYDTLKAVVNVK